MCVCGYGSVMQGVCELILRFYDERTHNHFLLVMMDGSGAVRVK